MVTAKDMSKLFLSHLPNNIRKGDCESVNSRPSRDIYVLFVDIQSYKSYTVIHFCSVRSHMYPFAFSSLYLPYISPLIYLGLKHCCCNSALG